MTSTKKKTKKPALPPQPTPMLATCPAWCAQSHPPMIGEATEHQLVVADHVFGADRVRARQSTFRFQLSAWEDHWDGDGSSTSPVLWLQTDRGEGHDLTAAECHALAASFTASAVLLELAQEIDGRAA
jgi:hypothetical protein